MGVFFGHTMTASSAFYRMINYAKKMRRSNTNTYWNTWDPVKMNNSANNYFIHGLADPKTQNEIVNELTFLHDKKYVNIWVMQLVGNVWGLALMDYIQKSWNQPFITEIDDYFLHVNESSRASAFYAPGSEGKEIASDQVRDSSMVIVSTEYLKQKLQHLNSNIKVIPNSVDFSLWKTVSRNHGDKVLIGWEGAHGHEIDLQIIEKVVPAILAKYPQVEFQFIGDPDLPEEWLKHDRVKINKCWLPVTKYPAYKASLEWDIELAPLADSEFNRCKSNLRWLEASAIEIPVVASDVIPYRNTTADLCSTDEEWIDAISKLVENRKLREAKGADAYFKVRREYNVTKIAKDYAKTLQEESARVSLVVGKLKESKKI